MLGRPADQKWDEVYWYEALGELQAQTRPMFEAAGMEPPHAQDLQNCLCEFTKHERARRKYAEAALQATSVAE